MRIFGESKSSILNPLFMNVEWFIAHRLLAGEGRKSVAVPIVKIAVAGIALGLCVMLLSLFVITGFKNEITGKLSGFVSHLNVVPYASGNVQGEMNVEPGDSLMDALRHIRGVTEVYKYIEKPAILKSESEIHGVVMKGVDSTFRMDFFQQNMRRGDVPDFSGEKASNEVLISSTVADMLKVDVGDKLMAHFVQDPPRARRLVVTGVYDTGFKEYDDVIVLVDLRHLARLNDWRQGEVSGVAINVDDARQSEMFREQVYDKLDMWDKSYLVTSLRDEAPQIFDWLSLLNMNVWVILVLIVTVAGFNMVSGLLVLILDKTTLIGVLKALGCRDVSLRKLFLYISCELMLRGMVWGNALAFVLAGIQICFRVIHLDPAVYYMSEVPINFNLWHVLLLNAGVMFVTVVMLVLPTMLVSRISPIKAIRFE